MFCLLKSKKEDGKVKIREALDNLKLSFSEVNSMQDEFILKLQTRKHYVSDPKDSKPLNFKEASRIEFVDKIFMQDLSTDEQVHLGLNIFHVKIDKTTSSPLHFHEKRSQLLFIIKGNIYDNVTKMMFNPGESYFISKRNKHSIKYMEGAELLFIYMPGLKTIHDEQK